MIQMPEAQFSDQQYRWNRPHSEPVMSSSQGQKPCLLSPQELEELVAMAVMAKNHGKKLTIEAEPEDPPLPEEWEDIDTMETGYDIPESKRNRAQGQVPVYTPTGASSSGNSTTASPKRPIPKENPKASTPVPKGGYQRAQQPTNYAPTPKMPPPMPPQPEASDTYRVLEMFQNMQHHEDTTEEFLPVIPGQNRAAAAMENIELPRNVQSLYQWGQAIVQHGSTWKHKTYAEAYANTSYRAWVLRNHTSMTPALRDFRNYVIRMEQERRRFEEVTEIWA